MLKLAFIIASLFSSFLFLYRPIIDYTIFDFYVKDMCYYKKSNDFIEYVRACEKGSHCIKSNYSTGANTHEIGICQEYIAAFKKFNEPCTKNECNTNLTCESNKCSLPGGNSPPYMITDPLSRKINYYCNDNSIAILKNDSDSDPSNYPKCRTSNDFKDKCITYNGNKEIKTAPGYMKVYGNIDVKESSGIYSKQNVLTAEIGSIKVNTNSFVEDEMACETGSALYFYLDKNVTPPSKYSSSNIPSEEPSKICVNVTGISLDSSGKCIIRYNNGEGESIYGYNVNATLYNKNNFDDCELIMLKQKLFQAYLKIYKDYKNECENGKYYEEPYTCGNDELRKLWYYYNNPKEFLLYEDDYQVISYLIESNYPTSNETIKETPKSKGLLIKINLFLIFLILLSF